MAEVWWWLLATVAPIPGFVIWTWRKRRAEARFVAELMEERRARFGGSIKTPGATEPVRLERPDR